MIFFAVLKMFKTIFKIEPPKNNLKGMKSQYQKIPDLFYLKKKKKMRPLLNFVRILIKYFNSYNQ